MFVVARKGIQNHNTDPWHTSPKMLAPLFSYLVWKGRNKLLGRAGSESPNTEHNNEAEGQRPLVPGRTTLFYRQSSSVYAHGELSCQLRV